MDVVSTGFRDNFNDGSMNAEIWDLQDPASQTTVQEANQRLEIGLASGVVGLQWNGYRTVNTFDFTGAHISAKVVQVDTAGASGKTEISVADETTATSDGWVFWIANSTIGGDEVVAGVAATAFSIPYVAATHQYLKIRHSTGDDKIYFEVSENSYYWSVLGSLDRNVPLTNMYLRLSAGTLAAVADPGIAIFDNFKTNAVAE